jgi:transcriptional regulator with XRE-family HTH domain
MQVGDAMAKQTFFAERLRALRRQAELSQPALATRAGLAVSTIRQFEYGLREPAFDTLLKLAKGLGVSLAAFEPERAVDGAELKPRRKRNTKA